LLREMITMAQKYNASISIMRASSEQQLEMPAFYHPFTKNRNLQNNSNVMKCLQNNHKARTVWDLLQILTRERNDIAQDNKPNNQCKKRCCSKAVELLNRIEYKWNPRKETPQRLDLWHTLNRIKRNKNKDPQYSLITFNPDTRSMHCLLGGIRIFRKIPGHKSKEGDPFRKDKSPARTRNNIEPGGGLAKIIMDSSAVNNGWENATAGIGIWYADGSR